MAVYLGEADEDKILNMSLVFIDSVMEFIGKRINFEAVANYAGNSFMKDSWKMIEDNHPMKKKNVMEQSGLGQMLKNVKLKRVKANKGTLTSVKGNKKEK